MREAHTCVLGAVAIAALAGAGGAAAASEVRAAVAPGFHRRQALIQEAGPGFRWRRRSVLRRTLAPESRSVPAATVTASLLARLSVDRLPDQVGVTVVPRVLLDHVHEHPPERDASLAAPRGVGLVKRLSLPLRQLRARDRP